MNGVSLFSGIGGLDLAAIACGIVPILFCEIEPFPCEILGKRFPGIPIIPDVRHLKGDELGPVDIVYGGFPCQDLSLAGRRAGLCNSDGSPTRSGLWFEMLRICEEARPRYVVAENVRGALNAANDTVTAGLENAGYKVWTLLIPASAIGAPHQRERMFVVALESQISCAFSSLADSLFEGLQGWSGSVSFDSQRPQSSDELAPGCSQSLWRTPDAHADRGAMSEVLYQRRVASARPININAQVAHFERLRLPSDSLTTQLNADWVEELMGYPRGWTDPEREEPGIWMGWPAKPGESQFPYEHPRTVSSCKNRSKRLRSLGNSVVPQQAIPVFRAIAVIDYLVFDSACEIEGML